MINNQPYIEPKQLQRIAEGDKKAFYQLFKAYTPVLRSYIWKSTRSEIDTEEVLQETFIRIWIYRNKLPDVDNLPAWVYTMAARVCLNYLRTSFNHQKKIRMLSTQAGTVQADYNTPLSFTQVEAIRKDIQKAVLRLTEKRRVIYRMNREEGMKPSAIAEQLGISEGTVKNQLTAAMKEIRDFLVAAGHQMTWLVYLLMEKII